MRAVFIIFLMIWVIILLSLFNFKSEAIHFERNCSVAFYTPSSYLQELMNQGKYRLAYQFVRNQANKPSPDPFFLVKMSEFYLKGWGVDINHQRAEHWLTKYLQAIGRHSEK